MMFGLSDEQFEDFNIWLNSTYVIVRGRKSNDKKYIIVRDRKKKLSLGTQPYYDYVAEKIEHFKNINLIK